MRFVPRFLRRDIAVRVEPDPADLGTAFGMEASLTDLPADFRPVTANYGLESQGSRGTQESPLAWLSARRPA